MEGNLFEIKYLQIQVENWQEKKSMIECLFRSKPDSRNGIQSFLTNRQLDTTALRQPFVNILSQEFEKISKFVKKDISLEKIWSVTYEKGDQHLVHNHGHLGFAGILYMDINDDIPPTTYVQPWPDPYSDLTIYNPHPVQEGEIVVVPRFLLHFSQPNDTENKKRIIAFDLDFIK